MKLALQAVRIGLGALALGTVAVQGAQLFRIAGPVATTIIGLSADGYITWTNSPTNATFTIQTTASLASPIVWVDYLQVPATSALTTLQIYDPSPPVGMALIPAGSFTMGDTLDGESDALPISVYVSAFYMDVNLVSYTLWTNVYQWATSHGYTFHYAGSGKATNHPVQTVDWYDCVKWSNARSQQAGLAPVYYTDAGLTQVYTSGDTNAVYPNWSASGYRLPTEAEWEKAARGGLSGQRFPWGDTISESQANYEGNPASFSYDLGPNGYNTNFDSGAPYANQPYTSPVGYFAPNGYGLYNMAGNVWEYCWDWYGTPYGQPSATNPTGPATGGGRVARGGSWNIYADEARCAYRTVGLPDNAYYFVGFRCVRGFNATPPGMVLIPAGSFTMGDTLDGGSPSYDNFPTNIYVSAFYMDTNLVTYSLWTNVFQWATNHRYGFDYAGSGKATNHPVQTVDWYDCVKWSNARSQQAGLTPVYYTDAGLTQIYTNGDTDAVYPNWSASGYRLPTEAEWEKAARGGLSGQRFPWGDTISESQANYEGNTSYSYDLGPNGFNATYATGAEPYTSPVGSFAPNGYGLYDMAGNVYEWCWDWYGTPYGQPTATNPTGATGGPGGLRVLRGGGWGSYGYYARCAFRSVFYPDNAVFGIGFRCVRGF